MQDAAKRDETQQGPKYHLDIEGNLHDWDSATVTPEKIAELGGWNSSDGVLVIDADQNQRQLAVGEVVELKPGMGFSKKVKFRRGADRIGREMELVRGRFPAAELKSGWVWLPEFELPEGWTPRKVAVATRFPPGYPTAPPYGVFVPSNLQFKGQPPQNFVAPAGEQPPFPGAWGILSWTIDWHPHSEVGKGTHFLNWILSFHNRFAEGN